MIDRDAHRTRSRSTLGGGRRPLSGGREVVAGDARAGGARHRRTEAPFLGPTHGTRSSSDGSAERNDVRFSEVLKGALKIAPREQTQRAENRVANILTELGFTKYRPRRNGKREYRYCREDEPNQTRTTRTTLMSTEPVIHMPTRARRSRAAA